MSTSIARGFHVEGYDAKLMKPSKLGVEYLKPIFINAIGQDDMTQPYHSVNTDVNKRIRLIG